MRHGCTAFARNYGKTRELSQRELEILDLVTKGMKNKQIAVVLGISAHTVKNHLRNIFQIIEVTSRSQATIWYLTIHKKDKE